jgi:hypothetical protein
VTKKVSINVTKCSKWSNIFNLSVFVVTRSFNRELNTRHVAKGIGANIETLGAVATLFTVPTDIFIRVGIHQDKSADTKQWQNCNAIEFGVLNDAVKSNRQDSIIDSSRGFHGQCSIRPASF